MAQFLVVTHMGGLPDLSENANYTMVANNSGITMETGTFKKTDFLTQDEFDKKKAEILDL